MADLTQNTSSYAVGTQDTYTELINDGTGVAGNTVIAEYVNGPNSALVQIQNVLGQHDSLVGTAGTLAARLGVATQSNGKLNALSSTTKTTFPPTTGESMTGVSSLTGSRVLKVNSGGTALEVADEKGDSDVMDAGWPPGCVMPFGATTPPAGWLICNGATISRSIYADLFAVIGTIWGAGNGSTTFTIPHIGGRVVIGSGQGPGLSNRTVGQSSGTESSTLVDSNLPAHTHALRSATDTSPGSIQAFTGNHYSPGQNNNVGPTGGSPANPIDIVNNYITCAYIIKY